MTTETIQTLTQVIKEYQTQLADAKKETEQYKKSAKHWLNLWREKAQEVKDLEEASKPSDAQIDTWTRIDSILAQLKKERERPMKQISIDNGLTFVTPEEAIKGMRWEVIAHYMEDEAREAVHDELAPCTDLDFLTRYLQVADHDLVIG